MSFKPLSGHLGVRKTNIRVGDLFYWPHMHKDISDFVRCCHICQTFKTSNIKLRAPLKSIITTKPWDIINIDVTGPLTRTDQGNRYVIVVVDMFSKWVEAVETPDFTADTTAKF